MSQYFQVDPSWISSAAVGICARNGIILKDAISSAESGAPVSIQNDSEATLLHLVTQLHQQLSRECDNYLHAHRQRLRLSRHSYPYPPAVNRLNEKEQSHCREMIIRVAVTGALADYQRRTGRCVLSPSTTGLSSSLGETPTLLARVGDVPEEDGAAQLHRSVQTTLLQGLLYAFEAFQECHSMNRDHYPPRMDNKTPGTVGWDTLVLLHLVHRIPQVGRYARGSAIDDSIGKIVRTWRKLLVALQSVDADEAPEHSRRRGALALVNGLLIILFQRYNTHQCTVLLSAVDHAEQVAQSTKDMSRSILHPSQHMISEVVTFHYYKGRMRLYERELEAAHSSLRQAYTLLPPAGYGNEAQRLNKERVRFYLAVAGVANGHRIPTGILRASDGVLPRLFGPLVWAIERGDHIRFTQALATNEAVFHRRGVYLILQQATTLCFLMLVARVHAAIAAFPETDNSRISISTLLSAYNYITNREEKPISPGTTSVTPSPRDSQPTQTTTSSTHKRHRSAKEADDANAHEGNPERELNTISVLPMDEDRMTLWVAKLIASQYVRGYYSHEHKTLVLSKKVPFPLLQPTTS